MPAQFQNNVTFRDYEKEIAELQEENADLKVVVKSLQDRVTELEKNSYNAGDHSVGYYNVGHSNTGDHNIGHSNTGNHNTGSFNEGDCNTGNFNTGSFNAGDCNTGDCNTGNCNVGDSNVGDCNTGNLNTGSFNAGDHNAGDCNTGNCNAGDCNAGDHNAGDHNTGHSNAGWYNTGDCNAGHSNAGWCNTGNHNTGSFNIGWYNTGSYNTGSFNSCNNSSGFFCSVGPKARVFNQEIEMTVIEFRCSKYMDAIYSSPFVLTEWVQYNEEEKDTDKKKAVGGYLKSYSYEEACANWWSKMTAENKEIIKSIPNFNAAIFEEITGIKI